VRFHVRLSCDVFSSVEQIHYESRRQIDLQIATRLTWHTDANWRTRVTKISFVGWRERLLVPFGLGVLLSCVFVSAIILVIANCLTCTESFKYNKSINPLLTSILYEVHLPGYAYEFSSYFFNGAVLPNSTPLRGWWWTKLH